MGRRKIATPEMIFFLRTDQKPNKQGQHPIYFRYVYDEKKVDKATGLRVKPNEWDSKRLKVKANNPQCDEYNGRMQLLKGKFDKAIIEYENVKNSLSLDIIKEILSGKDMLSDKAEDEDFFELAYSHLERQSEQNRLKPKTYKSHKNLIKLFNDFIIEKYNVDSIYCSNIDQKMLESYISWRKERENINDTINKALEPLVKCIRLASTKGLIKNEVLTMLEDIYLPIRTQIGSEDKKEDDIKYLTFEQLIELKELYPKLKYNTTRNYVDMFFFVVYTGLRVSDIITLKWSNRDFENEILTKTLYKTGQRVTIPLLAPALEILNTWKRANINDVFVFNQLLPDFDLSEDMELVRLINNKNTTIGKSLETVGKKLDLPFNMRMHCGRHTLSVLAINNGVNIHTLAKVLGHQDSSTTEKRYAKLLPKTIESEIKDKLSSLNFTPNS